MGNSFNKIESKIDTISSVETLGWRDTQIPLDTVESLGWRDTDVALDTVESLGWQNTDAEESSDENIKKMIPDEDDSESASATSSPFISTELYNKIIGNNQLGGKKNIKDSSSSSSSNSSDSTTSTSDLGEMLSLSDYSKHSKKNHSQTGSSIEAYGFSNTSSELSQNFVINSDTSVSINKDSSSINTSDINLVSVENSDINVVSANSVNGKRFI